MGGGGGGDGGGGGGGGGFNPYCSYMGDVPLDRVWFSDIPVLKRVYNSRVCVSNRVCIPWTFGRVLLSSVAYAHVPICGTSRPYQ